MYRNFCDHELLKGDCSHKDLNLKAGSQDAISCTQLLSNSLIPNFFGLSIIAQKNLTKQIASY